MRLLVKEKPKCLYLASFGDWCAKFGTAEFACNKCPYYQPRDKKPVWNFFKKGVTNDRPRG